MPQKVILAFGDSLTYGANPRTGGPRHDYEDRWPTVLEQGLDGAARVIAEGLGGRTTVHDDHFSPADRNGARVLPTLLASHGPLDLVILMLGTNDLKPFHGRTAFEASKGVGRLVEIVRGHAGAKGEPIPEIIIVSPPHLGDTDHPEMMVHFGQDAAIAESRSFAHWYRRRADEYGTAFFDAATVAKPSPLDGVHLDAANTRAIGAGLVPVVKEVLGL
ncbi:MAG TPA: SGNH/GDSL hydrolase family protein [Devosia sp.]|nr:SGNH/GDSL hydrolase family protein [Devosia sp.]